MTVVGTDQAFSAVSRNVCSRPTPVIRRAAANLREEPPAEGLGLRISSRKRIMLRTSCGTIKANNVSIICCDGNEELGQKVARYQNKVNADLIRNLQGAAA